MTDPIDLDRLDALCGAASVPLSWRGGKAGIDQRAAVLDAVFNLGNAMVEAWPSVSAELRRLRAEVAEARAGRCETANHDTKIDDIMLWMGVPFEQCSGRALADCRAFLSNPLQEIYRSDGTGPMAPAEREDFVRPWLRRVAKREEELNRGDDDGN